MNGTLLPSGAASPSAASAEAVERLARRMLHRHGAPQPERSFDWPNLDDEQRRNAVSTCLMDLYRRGGSAEVFEVLLRVAMPQLRKRVLGRTRYLGMRIDPNEVLQDAFINIYRYPVHFDGSRPGAFRAWSNTIVDNAIRRHMRRSRGGLDIQLMSDEVLARQSALGLTDPREVAIQNEGCDRIASAYAVLLSVYLHAYAKLSDRERFVLQMVEVRRLKYAELAKEMSIRPEALKMVVFRARRRIAQHMERLLENPEPPAVREAG